LQCLQTKSNSIDLHGDSLDLQNKTFHQLYCDPVTHKPSLALSTAHSI